MPEWQVAIITAIISVATSTGFWTFLQVRFNKKSSSSKMILGLGHDRIIDLGMSYIQRGSITHDELENLIDYLYVPYKEMGGNGAAERIVNQVKTLPVTATPETWPAIDRRKPTLENKEKT